jgi:hypothetical protein
VSMCYRSLTVKLTFVPHIVGETGFFHFFNKYLIVYLICVFYFGIFPKKTKQTNSKKGIQ